MGHKVLKVKLQDGGVVDDDGVWVTLESFLNKCAQKYGKLASLNIIAPDEYMIIFVTSI